MNWNNYSDEVLKGCLTGIMKLGAVIILLTSTICLCGCKQVDYVPVVEHHTEHHWHTDSVRQHDSVLVERETTIRELDSAAMAQYGIQLKSAERAWLVHSREQDMRIRELERLVSSRDTVHDSIPKPYPVEVVKVKTDYSGWLAFAVVLVVAGFVVYLIRKK